MGLLMIAVTFLATLVTSNALDVTEFGAVGNGQADDTSAFLKAWGALCGSAGDATLVVPKGGTFLLQSVQFQGPCKGKIVHVQVQGTLLAPRSLKLGGCKNDFWVQFRGVDNLVLDGHGILNGQGSIWWDAFLTSGLGGCNRPTGLKFVGCNNLLVNGLSLIDSPRNHIAVTSSNGATIANVKLTAPDESPNTDGIDVSNSRDVNIRDSIIATGDDCVAINEGTVNISITGVECGPGHGISVGSLGGSGAVETVDGVLVQNCKFTRTDNGARIKTWAGGKGFARRITYDQITLVDVKNPIIIDQFYVNRRKTKPNMDFDSILASSSLQVSDVTFSGFQGTSTSEEAISLRCTSCSNIKLNQVTITAAGGNPVRSVCQNAQGSAIATVPPVPCLGS